MTADDQKMSNSPAPVDEKTGLTNWNIATLILAIAVIYLAGFVGGDQHGRAKTRELKRQIFISATVCGAVPESSSDFACDQLAELSR